MAVIIRYMAHLVSNQTLNFSLLGFDTNPHSSAKIPLCKVVGRSSVNKTKKDWNDRSIHVLSKSVCYFVWAGGYPYLLVSKSPDLVGSSNVHLPSDYPLMTIFGHFNSSSPFSIRTPCGMYCPFLVYACHKFARWSPIL